jgi:membrane protease YdiL (CAAX protease family)
VGIYIEALILYVILFFAGSVNFIGNTVPVEGAAGYSIIEEVKRIGFYIVPSFALIWYLMFKERKPRAWGIIPCVKDITAGFTTLFCLLIIGFAVAFVSSHIGGAPAQTMLFSPTTALGWVTLCTSCLLGAYLEESFFRFYILSRRNELGLTATSALVLSVALFSICHIYEGAWGFLNAVLSGTVLCFIFLRYKTIHGIAIAHAMYNIAIYVINSLISGDIAAG